MQINQTPHQSIFSRSYLMIFREQSFSRQSKVYLKLGLHTLITQWSDILFSWFLISNRTKSGLINSIAKLENAMKLFKNKTYQNKFKPWDSRKNSWEPVSKLQRLIIFLKISKSRKNKINRDRSNR